MIIGKRSLSIGSQHTIQVAAPTKLVSLTINLKIVMKLANIMGVIVSKQTRKKACAHWSVVRNFRLIMMMTLLRIQLTKK